MSFNFSGSYAIKDNTVISFIDSINYSGILQNIEVTNNFCSNYKDWILSTTLNSITGLDNFNFLVYSNGTSQSFDMFYIKNKDRRFRCFKGEYLYHQLAWRNNWKSWKYIDDEPIHKNDAVVISLPFSDTGNKHFLMDQLLRDCELLKVPVLVDCAYFGICKNINFNFNYDCITDVVFSLSKTFPVANARIGIRFSKVDDDDLMFVYQKMDYTNKLGAHLGNKLIEHFSPDYIHNKYNDKQTMCCNILGITPSNTVIFGIDSSKKYNEYNRGSITNRLGLHKLLTEEKQKIKEILNASANP